ncbi:MAG: apolipoprotein N-acyltransferase [Proteobacteria bacterium]|nr:apolipoprotein N-acyltransferase [Pseudomonadota bacterium]MDA0992454.1 apolipoprotein N-acyltransferase [Pseudomonadota bacterium]
MSEKFSFETLSTARPWLTRFAFLLLGSLVMLSFAPFGFYVLAPLLVMPLLYAFTRSKPRQAFQLGFCFGAGLFLAGTYWLYISIHVFGEAPLVLAVILMLGLVIIMALYYGAAGWAISLFCNGGMWSLVWVAPSVWVLLEWLRGWVLSGFPWMTLGYTQIDSPLAGLAPVIGVYGLSLLLMISASGLLAVLQTPGKTRLSFAAVAVLPWIIGYAAGSFSWTEPSGQTVRTTIVQGGVSQDRKWLPEQFAATLELYRNSLLENGESDLVVWPEVAIPSVIDQVESYIAQLELDVAAHEQTLLFGILERDLRREQVFNSVVSIGGDGRQIYRKRHLVPFGEYFPVPDFVREWMRLMNLPYSDIAPGDDVQPLLKIKDGNQLSVAICYEDAYATEQLYALPEAGILVNVSNDAWFGDSIAPHQHLEIARMRALELGRPVVRATNNGVSAFIGSDGALLSRGPQFEFVELTGDVQPRTGLTPYARMGNRPVVLFSLTIILWTVWYSRRP